MHNIIVKHPVITVGSIVIILLLSWGFWPKPIFVETIKIKKSPMSVTIDEEGRTRVIDRYVISAPVDGVACRVQLDVGDHVEQGQVLLNITPLDSQVLDPRSRAQTQAQVAAAESALHAAQELARAATEKQKLAYIELERLRPLMDKGVISKDAFDKVVSAANTAEASKRSADFTVEVSHYDLKAKQALLEYTANLSNNGYIERVPIHSPITGRILKVFRKCEGPVKTGEPLLEVGDPSALEIEVDALSSDAVKIKPGMQVKFDRWGGKQSLEGIVRLIEPVGFTKTSALGVEEQRVLVISDFTSPAEVWQRLGDGYRVEAKFILWHDENVLQIPTSSIFRIQDDWAVFVVENNTAKLRKIKIGKRNGLYAQILDGLNLDEIVIDHPANDIENGKKVRFN